MYGMNQAYHAPDPSAQVPNHLVCLAKAPRPSCPTNRTACPCSSDIVVPLPDLAWLASRSGPRVSHQRPADCARHLARCVDVSSSPSARWNRYPHLAAPAHGKHVCVRRNGLGRCRERIRHECARLCMCVRGVLILQHLMPSRPFRFLYTTAATTTHMSHMRCTRATATG